MTEPIHYPSMVEHVRLRPGMYVGGIDKEALHVILFEVLDDSIAEIETGHGDHIWITLGPDTQITVRDNGRGLPVYVTERGVPMLQSIMTGGDVPRWRNNQHLEGAGHKAGLSTVNGLSSELVVDSATEGWLWRQDYRAGIPTGEVIRVRDLQVDESTGTTITFNPDFTIMEPNEFDYTVISDRARELAYLHSNLTISLEDQRDQRILAEEFHFPGFLTEFVTDLNRGKPVLHHVISASAQWTIEKRSERPYSIAADVAIQYTDTMETNVIGFVNNMRTAGGFHIDAMLIAIRAVMNSPSWFADPERTTYSENEIRPGLTAVVRVLHPQPSFEPHRRSCLTSADVSGIVADLAYRAFPPNYQQFDYETKRDKYYDPLREKCLRNRAFLSR